MNTINGHLLSEEVIKGDLRIRKCIRKGCQATLIRESGQYRGSVFQFPCKDYRETNKGISKISDKSIGNDIRKE